MIAGIDTHKDTLAVAVVDDSGRLVAGGDVPNTERGFAQLVDMFTTHHVQRVGIEGSGSFGRAVAVHLVVCWQPDWPATVVEVPTLMTSRERRGQLGKGKTDPVDALAIARITTREQQLRRSGSPSAPLRICEPCSITARTWSVNAAPWSTGPTPNWSVCDPATSADPDPDHSRPGPGRAGADRRRHQRPRHLVPTPPRTRHRHRTKAAELKRQITRLVAAADTTLTDLYGVGPLIAARFIAEVVDIRRYPNRNAFAAANGTAPLPASSGRTVRHRFNPGGNRQLNRSLYTIALHPDSWRHRRPRLLRTQTGRRAAKREALRCLKRRLSDIVFATMRHDAAAAAAGPTGILASLVDPGGSGCGRRK